MKTQKTSQLIRKIHKHIKHGEIEPARSVLTELLSSGYKDYGQLLDLANNLLLSYSKIGMETNIKILQYIYHHSKGEAYFEAAFLLGVYHYRNYQFSKADEYLNIPGIEKNHSPRSYRIHSAIHQNKYALAEELISAGLSYWKHNPDAIHGRATILYNLGDYEKAKTCYLDYVRQSPDLTASHYLSGLYFKHVEANLDLAKASFEKALQVIETDKFLQYYDYYLPTENIQFDLKGEYLEVLKELGENGKLSSLLSKPEYKDYRLGWQIQQLWEEDEWEKCNQLLLKLYQDTDHKVQQRYYAFMRGETFFQAGDIKRAKDAYLEALHIGETVWMPEIDEFVSVFLCRDLDMPDLDTTYLDIAFRLDKSDTIKKLISKLFHLGRFEKTIKYCQFYATDLKDPLFILKYLGYSYMSLNNHKLAIVHLERLTEFLATHTGALKLLHQLYLKQNLKQKANQVREKLDRIDNYQ